MKNTFTSIECENSHGTDIMAHDVYVVNSYIMAISFEKRPFISVWAKVVGTKVIVEKNSSGSGQ